MLCSQLSKGFHSCILNAQKESDGGKMGLMDFVRKSMFPAVVNELFGEENLSMTNVKLYYELLVTLYFFFRRASCYKCSIYFNVMMKILSTE